MKAKPRSLLGIEPLDSRQILEILTLAKRMNPSTAPPHSSRPSHRPSFLRKLNPHPHQL